MVDSVSTGEWVVDRDDDDPNDALVVSTPPVTAAEWDVPGRGGTVADDETNADYPDDAAVVVVVFENAVNEHGLEADEAPFDLSALASRGVPFYSFPEPRLAPVGAGDEEDDSEPEPSEELIAIAKRLEAGGMKVEIDTAAQVVRAEKLGEVYVVDVDGVREGGVLRAEVEAAVKEAASPGREDQDSDGTNDRDGHKRNVRRTDLRATDRHAGWRDVREACGLPRGCAYER